MSGRVWSDCLIKIGQVFAVVEGVVRSLHSGLNIEMIAGACCQHDNWGLLL